MLSLLPTAVYSPENPFGYPRNDYQNSPVEQQLIAIYTPLCADTVVFNSSFNRKPLLKMV